MIYCHHYLCCALVSRRRKVANEKDDMRMVLDPVHEDLASGPFCDILIWLSNLPQSEGDDFCNGFVEDLFRALAQTSDRFPDRVVQLALLFLLCVLCSPQILRDCGQGTFIIVV